jgi:hypothetical protein
VVGSAPRIPAQLKFGPFTLAEARAAGVSRTALQGKSWRRVSRGLYCWSGLLEDPLKFLFAYQRLVPDSVFSGASAAWLYGIDVDPLHPIEVIVPTRSGLRTRPGLTVRHTDLGSVDVVRRRGLRVTNVLRAISDLSHKSSDIDALIVLDQALRLRLADRDALSLLHPLGALAAPAESPMETRLRWLLIDAGLPRPEVQRELADSEGRFVGRADLYYPSARLVVEFDGGNHRDRMVEDLRGQNLLMHAGYRLLRFTSADYYNRPKVIVSLVRDELSGRAAASSTPLAAAPR